MRGKPHKQISYDLGISERTIKLHRHQLVEKLKARSLAELAVIAERLKLLLFVRASWRRGKQVRTRDRRQARFAGFAIWQRVAQVVESGSARTISAKSGTTPS